MITESNANDMERVLLVGVVSWTLSSLLCHYVLVRILMGIPNERSPDSMPLSCGGGGGILIFLSHRHFYLPQLR